MTHPTRGCRGRDLQELLKKTPISGGSHLKLGWLRERNRHEENPMRTSKKILGIENDRTKPSAARRRRAVAGLALATLVIAAGVAKPTRGDTSSSPPVDACSDFACER
jgi:hypothetical protein